MLNINQKRAVFAENRFIFLLAGAGTGKTKVIEERVKRLLLENVLEENFLIISFTKKSVNELKRRLKEKNILITTFHGLCYQYLNKNRKIKIVSDSFLIENGWTKEGIRKIDLFKRNNMANKYVKSYNTFLKKHQLLDFTDLEHLFYQKLKKDNILLNEIRNIYTYIFIDEFQDTSYIQYEILKRLTSKKAYIFCVGDPNQAIYRFRGASKKIIDLYIKDYQAITYYLDLNYRSNIKIITLANTFLSHTKSQFLPLHGYSKNEGDVFVKYYKDKDTFKEDILKEVRNLLKTYNQKDIAFLYRNHHQGLAIKHHFYSTYYQDLNFLTIHQAKGLEFDVVFLIGLEEGELPLKGSDLKEESNLFYVGVTRAKKRLYLCSTINKNKPSRFINISLKRVNKKM